MSKACASVLVIEVRQTSDRSPDFTPRLIGWVGNGSCILTEQIGMCNATATPAFTSRCILEKRERTVAKSPS